MAFELPPDAQDLSKTVTIDKALSPYVSWWYARVKLPGETVNQFFERTIGKRAFDAYVGDYTSDVVAVQEEAQQTELDALRDEVDTARTNAGL